MSEDHKARFNQRLVAMRRRFIIHLRLTVFAIATWAVTTSASGQTQRNGEPSLVAAIGSPIGDPGSWVKESDYPAEARRAGVKGRVAVLLNIGTKGRVIGCAVTSSSGSTALDNVTCRVLTKRGRFTILKNAEGALQTYSYTYGTRWG